jgi:outer membrane immunogenic protein
MKSLITGAFLGTAVVSSAFAADMPVKARPIAPAVYDWSGIYAGGNVGAAWDSLRALDVTQPSGGFFTDLVPAGTEGFDLNKTGIAGGFQLGAQKQWGSFVLGAEATYSLMDLEQTITSPYFPASDTETGKVQHLVTAVARVGYAFDRMMVYAKGGYAGGRVEFKARDNVAGVTYEQKLWQNGFALGAGLEYALTNSIILGVDYSHVDLGKDTSTGPNVLDAGGIGAFPETYETKAKIDLVTARVSYKFSPY